MTFLETMDALKLLPSFVLLLGLQLLSAYMLMETILAPIERKKSGIDMTGVKMALDAMQIIVWCCILIKAFNIFGNNFLDVFSNTL